LTSTAPAARRRQCRAGTAGRRELAKRAKRYRTLISGSGIAGTAAALLLHRDGHEVTVVEKAPAFRHLGYCLSIKYFGRWVMRELGLLDELRRREIPIERLRFVDENGVLIREYPGEAAVRAVRGATFVNRADLHEVLTRAAGGAGNVRLATSIVAVDHRGAEVLVTFSDGSSAAFDLVVVAEGVHSSTRDLVWSGSGYRPFDVIYAAALTRQPDAVAPGTLEMHLGVGKTMMLVPTGTDDVLVQCYFRGAIDRDTQRRSPKALLQSAFAGSPPQVARIVDGIDPAADIFHDGVGLVTLPSLVERRVVLLGDAGYAPTFLSGMGASLGLLGARALSQVLSESAAGVEAALARYDELILPIARHYQASARTNLRTLLSASRPKTRLRESVMRLAPPALLLGTFGRQFEIEAELLREVMGEDAMPA
jgi:2-polyprenyl-6-methoxyphenol hydroxylase-like FAD-dependent oxidoreductase